MEEQAQSQRKTIITFLAVIIVVVVIVGAVAAASKNKSATSIASSSRSASMSATAAKSTATYTDGEYKATGSYESPGGTENIAVDVTIANNIVTATTATSGANDSEAEVYQSQFISGLKKYVVGKNVNDIKLSRVSGSSLTSQGFNDALTQIRNQAKA